MSGVSIIFHNHKHLQVSIIEGTPHPVVGATPLTVLHGFTNHYHQVMYFARRTPRARDVAESVEAPFHGLRDAAKKASKSVADGLPKEAGKTLKNRIFGTPDSNSDNTKTKWVTKTRNHDVTKTHFKT